MLTVGEHSRAPSRKSRAIYGFEYENEDHYRYTLRVASHLTPRLCRAKTTSNQFHGSRSLRPLNLQCLQQCGVSSMHMSGSIDRIGANLDARTSVRVLSLINATG